ncbi:hypothetical protein VTJ04DRAFT_3204 [Mycothermus thermophilus]|uniref:uncharacterized protein n=1 Tax=Humicola insolens TaxID=85995 RepID=UPI003742B626
MSYPGPPGVSKPSNSSLPPRPPVTNLPGFKPAFKPAFQPAPAVSAPGYTAPAPTPSGYGPVVPPAPTSYGASPAVPPYAAPAHPAASAIGATRPGYGPTAPYAYGPSQTTYAPQATAPYYGTAAAAAPTATPGAYPAAAPHVRNPYAADNSDYDPEMAAQIAQWQSAYMPRDPNDPSNKAGAANGTNPAAGTAPGVATDGTDGTAPATTEKKKTVIREGGGKKWQDDTLLEWDPSHLRLFVGNLAGETTDESLLKAFSRWKSVQKAKVIRDKRTNKSKGFGFVSFSDPEDFFQAAKEMNGKYIQSHPVVVRKAKTEIKPVVVKEEKNKGKQDKDKKKSGSGMGAGGSAGSAAYEPRLGPAAGAGITKPGQKTKGGLKLLG